jgi:hypothetical protein
MRRIFGTVISYCFVATFILIPACQTVQVSSPVSAPVESEQKTSNLTQNTTTPTTATTSEAQLAVNFEPNSGATVTPGIILEQVEAFMGTLPFNGSNPWGPTTIITSGSPCILVSGAFVNVSDQAWQLDFWADGFSSNGQVSWTLDSGALSGHVQAVLAPGGMHYFTLHLNWAESVALIKVSAHTYSTAIPIP